MHLERLDEVSELQEWLERRIGDDRNYFELTTRYFSDDEIDDDDWPCETRIDLQVGGTWFRWLEEVRTCIPTRMRTRVLMKVWRTSSNRTDCFQSGESF